MNEIDSQDRGNIDNRNEQKARKFSSSLISRFAASTALLAAVIVLIAVTFFQLLMGHFFDVSFTTPLKEWTHLVASRIGHNKELAQAVAKNHRVGVVFVNGTESYAFDVNGSEVEPDVLFREPGKFRRIDVINGNGQRFAFLLDKEQFAQDQSPLLLWVVTLILVIISSVYALQASQLRPLKWLGAGVDAVSRGDFSIRVPVVRKDEIGEVAHSFNLMAERVQQMLDDRERLLADVSHELRSPLARIKVAVDLLPEGDKKGLIARDIIEMESLIAVLLEREQLKNNLSNITNESVNPVVLVADIIDSLNSAEPMIELNVGTGDLKFIGDAALVKVLIQNLLDNACKFSLPDSQPVVVSIDRKEKNIIITIEDDGIGVPEDKLEEILEAFVKLDPARGHRVGYGLGLNLCQRIMQAHDGGIRIENRECGGTRIVVTFGLN